MREEEQMEEVQQKAKACKSCTPFTKINIPNIMGVEDYHYNKHCNKQSKQAKLLNRSQLAKMKKYFPYMSLP